jgi:pimeloyl-ACP methyl ester carboxylesterase
MTSERIVTKRGATVRVLVAGGGAPLVFLHGVSGFLAPDPFLDRLAARYRVYAPELPGYGESAGEELLEDMLDFALHGWDVVSALHLERPHLVGHSLGGMIAAEMAAIAPNDVAKLVLVGAAGLWLPEHPVPDLFSFFLPEDYARVLFRDADAGQAMLTRGFDFSGLDALAEFYIANSRRMATAGKLLFPLPDRHVAKRLYRVTAETLVLWGREDRLMPPAYGEKWRALIPGARLVEIEGAGHMLPYEQPVAFTEALTSFLG